MTRDRRRTGRNAATAFRKTGFIAAAVVVIVGAGFLWWRAQVESGGAAATSDSAPSDILPLPDLSKLEPAVQQQVRDQHAALTRTLTDQSASSSERAEAFGVLGRVLLAAELFNEAETAFQRAETLAPSDMRWPYYLAHVYRARQEPARAIPMFERALVLAPSDLPTLLWLGDLHLATGDTASAQGVLQRAYAVHPTSAAAASRLGRVALAQRDYARAIDYLERALALNPRAQSVHYPLGMAYRGMGQRARAEAHLKRASEQGGDPGDIAPADPLMDMVANILRGAGAFEARGMQALDARDWAAAVDNLRQAVALAPQNAVMRLNLGTALSLAGDSRAAADELREAIRLAPTLAKAHFSLGVIAQEEGRWDEAVERLTSAVTLDPAFLDARFALAEALRRVGRADESLAHYAEVLRLNPAASQARFGHAMALVRLQRYADARRVLTEAVDMHPDQAGFPHALARVLAAAPDPAVRDGTRALALMLPLAAAQPSPAVDETMAMAFAEVGRFDEAIDWQERAIAAATTAGQPALAIRMQDNLLRYRQRQPCRTPWRDDDPVIAATSEG